MFRTVTETTLPRATAFVIMNWQVKCGVKVFIVNFVGRRCNYQKKYWCDPFSRTCIPPSGRNNICGFVGEKEDSGVCQAGLRCECDHACSIRNLLRDLQGALSGVAQTIQDLVGRKKFCCKCV